MDAFPLPGLLRRLRRDGDCSQRELAGRAGVPKATLAAAEAGSRDLPVTVFARLAGAAGARVAVLGADGAELAPMDLDAVRDAADRLFPAHLDTRHGDERWWGGEHRPRTRQPRYTFDLDRRLRDRRRGDAVPEEHHAPTAGDSLAERAAARRDEARRRAADAWRTRSAEQGPDPSPDPFHCWCPAACDEVEDLGRDLPHANTCTCRCDLA
ncbi:helix-turn-helix domain-containing protein [Modestobacter versicolor]|uniref:helix-turn-helix domain-containing protein n=1 Tax=Modestobacter versicolor TaxID=429133 RepID=UPI0034E052A5